MISQYDIDYSMSLQNSPPRCQFYGLSTDSKPSDTANGSSFVEMDTGKLYFFDRAGMTWREFNA